VGTDPEALVREYDQTQGAPRAISAADVFEPATPIKIRERRGPNWSLAMILALAVLVGLVVYHLVSSSSPASPAGSRHVGAAAHKPAATHPAHPAPTATPAPPALANEVVIQLSATEACWVQLTTASGVQIYQGTVNPGSSMSWTEKQPVSLVLGNPAGVSLTVNGKNPIQAGQTNPVTLSLGPGQPVAG